jgi:hypothetical protein
MAITVKVDSWDDAKWDDSFSSASVIQSGDTFTVANIDLNNRVVVFAPASSAYTSNLTAKNWEDSSWDDAGSGLSSIQSGQTFTVNLLDFNNRVVWLSG